MKKTTTTVHSSLIRSVDVDASVVMHHGLPWPDWYVYHNMTGLQRSCC